MRISDTQVNEVRKLLREHSGDSARILSPSDRAAVDRAVVIDRAAAAVEESEQSSGETVVREPRAPYDAGGRAQEALSDVELIRRVTQEVVHMPDREDRIAELRAQIEAGEYNPTGDDIADAMIRRAIADRIR
jgi:anti-sigma28 factor (negative regulator of flagellin synthesis)